MPANTVRIRGTFDDKISPALSKIDNRFQGLSKSSGFKALTQGVGLGVGAAGFNLLADAASGAVGFMADSVNAARDMTETLSKSSVVFGPAAQEIEAFGETAAESIGLSKQAAIEAAATMGNFFTGLGEGQREAAGMSKRLVHLAGDLASFNNLDATDVLDKLRSGLTGEAEPLRRVGVFLTEAKVKAKAMQLGLGDAHGELSEGEKVLARYQLILDETGSAQGDFARTSEDLANRQRTASALLADSQAELGKAFEPVALQFTNLQVDVVHGMNAMDDAVRESQGTIRSWFGDTSLAEFHAAKLGESLVHAGKDADDKFTEAIGRAGNRTADFGRDADTAGNKLRDFRQEFLDTGNAIIEGYYDPIEMRQEMARNDSDITAAKLILNSKTTSDAEKRDARSTITQAHEDNDKLALELLATGKMTKDEHDALVKRLEKTIKTSTGKAKKYAQDLLAEIKKIDGYNAYVTFVMRVRSEGVGAQVHKGEHWASGGYVPPGTSGFVGEEGTEGIHTLPGGGAIITPHAGGTGGGGGSPTVNVVFNSNFPPSPSQGQQLANAVIPSLVRELRRQRLI